jgi:hypothetical protein
MEHCHEFIIKAAYYSKRSNESLTDTWPSFNGGARVASSAVFRELEILLLLALWLRLLEDKCLKLMELERSGVRAEFGLVPEKVGK